MPCPPESDWVALAEGSLPEPRRQACLDHLEACGSCRNEVAAAWEGLQEPLPARKASPWLYSAAAALLLAVGILSFRKPEAPLPAPTALRTSPASTETVSGSAVLLSLQPGGLLKQEAGTWGLERGTLRVESPAEPCRLRIGNLQVELLDGVLLAQVEPSPASPLLREASADEARVRVTLLEGRARLDGRELSAPASIGPPLVWTDAAWKPLLNGTESVREATRILLASPPPHYVFEALVRKKQESAELGVLFTAAGHGWEAAAGSNLLPCREAWTRLRVSVDGRACWVTLGAKDLISLPISGLAGNLSPGAGGTGLRAWGGSLEIRDARWRPLP